MKCLKMFLGNSDIKKPGIPRQWTKGHFVGGGVLISVGYRADGGPLFIPA